MALLGLFNRNNSNAEGEMSFLEHLEVLRWHLVRSAIVIVVLFVVFFFQKDFLFDQVIFAPKSPDFWTYKMLCRLSDFMGMGDALCISKMEFKIINTDLSGQFTMHMWAAFVAGMVVGFPYLLWEIWRFIKPALKITELKYSRDVVFYSSVLFMMGVLFGYYIIVPLSINFLGTYQISANVENYIAMDSFISTVTTITLAGGIVFELPIVIFFLTKFGIVTPAFMRTYRKHAVIIILIAAAVITPSPDVTSQLLVALPLYILYELSIFVSYYVKKGEQEL